MKTEKRYCINKLYRPRKEYSYDNDTQRKDEWQLQEYLYARNLMKQHNCTSIIDIGCGSGYKLVKYLGEYDTIGIDVSPTYEWLIQMYPDRKWIDADSKIVEKLSADLVMCVDVIEHVIDPDELIAFINNIDCKYIIISTPTRNLLYNLWNRGFWGPPKNPSHIREWSFKEFNNYISQKFTVIYHTITNTDRKHSTQMILCHKFLNI